MSETNSRAINNEIHGLETLRTQIETFERFVARRLSELSMEINATGQLVGMAEDTLKQTLSQSLSTLEAISYQGTGLSPVNAGVELNAVVKTTEDAANRILDSADMVLNLVKLPIDWTDETKRKDLLGKIAKEAETILMACAFQDLTGQRIATTLENLRKVEFELSSAFKRMGLKIDLESKDGQPAAMPRNFATSQNDIDSIFAAMNDKGKAGA